MHSLLDIDPMVSSTADQLRRIDEECRRSKRRPFYIADLFCGAGGTSAGGEEACEALDLRPVILGVNHWNCATGTFALNHPNQPRPLCTGVDDINPRSLFCPRHEKPTPERPHLDMLIASPECTHHSTARGGRPINEQSRATAMCVPKWCEALLPSIFWVENVPEFEDWGPCKRMRVPKKDGAGFTYELRPDPDRKGEIFHAWTNLLKSLGYRVEWRVLSSADAGDPTTRERLFVYGVRGKRKLVWPEPTHFPTAEGDLFTANRRLYRPARSFLDLEHKGRSIFDRSEHGKGLVVKTVRRILKGLETEVGGPFIVPARGFSQVRSIERPLHTITTEDRGNALIQHAFLLEHRGSEKDHPQGTAHSIDDPLGTVTAGGEHHAKVDAAFVLPNEGIYHGNAPRSIDKPLPTVTAERGGGNLIQARFLVHSAHGAKNGSDGRIASINKPVPTLAGHGSMGLADATFLVQVTHGNGTMGDNGDNRRVKSIDDPLPAVTGAKEWSKADAAFIVPNLGERDGQEPRHRSIDRPAPTGHTRGAGALVTTALLGQQAGAEIRNVNEPSPTVATKGGIGRVDYVITIDQQSNPNGVQSVEDPLSTVTTKERHSLIHADFLVSYYGTGVASSVDKPAPTVTTKARFAHLCAATQCVAVDRRVFRRVTYAAWKRLTLRRAAFKRPLPRLFLLEPVEGGHRLLMLEIYHRMLQVPELAAAQGFRKTYQFTGTKTEQVKQIGNAVTRRRARANIAASITQNSDVSWLPDDDD